MSALTIYGDSISGNCLKIKFVCDRLAIPYRWVETSVLKGETRTPRIPEANPAGQVPVVTWRDGRVLAQSDAIILHLAEGSALIPADAYERALMLQWMFWEQYSHETVIAVRRFHKTYLKKPEHEIDPALLPKGERVLAVMNDHLGRAALFRGRDNSASPISPWSPIRAGPHEGGFDLARYPGARLGQAGGKGSGPGTCGVMRCSSWRWVALAGDCGIGRRQSRPCPAAGRAIPAA